MAFVDQLPAVHAPVAVIYQHSQYVGLPDTHNAKLTNLSFSYAFANLDDVCIILLPELDMATHSECVFAR